MQAAETMDSRRQQLARQHSLNDQVKELYAEIRGDGIEVPRNTFATNASVEALVDQLVDAGVIDRVEHNIARYEYLIKYLKDLKAQNQPQETPS